MIALALSAAGCAKPPAKAPPPTTQKISFTYPIPQTCPSTTSPDASENYIITLGPNFMLTHPDVAKGGHKEGTPKHPRPNPTKLDVVTNLLEVGKAGTVTIALAKNSRLSFAQPDLAFAGGDADAPKIFCGPTYGTNSAGEATLTFTVLANSSVPYGSYILGLVAADQDPHSSDTLPIFIDPGVDNDGFQAK